MIQLILWVRPYSKYIFAGWIIVILTMSSIPSIPTLKIHTANSEIRLDYLIHFCEYGLLSIMAFLSLIKSDFRLKYRKLGFMTLSLIIFAFLDEFHQKFIPGRAFNIKDIISDISGVAAAAIFCVLVFRTIEKKNGQDHIHS